VVLDPRVDTWAVTLLDADTCAALPQTLPATRDPLLRASVWVAVRNAVQHALLGPEAALDLLEAALPAEDTDDGVGQMLEWAVGELVPIAADPAAARKRIHDVAARCVAGATAGDTLQLAAFQLQVATAADTDVLRSWLHSGPSLPDGVLVDLDLRWRILRTLARLGGVDRDELAAALADEPTAVSQVEHARALASIPDAEAKAWAWRHFTGEIDVPNYELEAIGLGLWQVGQDDLTAPYVARYFDELLATTEVRTGQMLGLATNIYYPRWSVSEETVARAHALLARDDVDIIIRRELVDETWNLERRLASRRAYA
jgi:aminopeptidase N